MYYVSTRDSRPWPERIEFEDVLLRGLAPDGGLYLPEQWPAFSAETIRSWRGLSYSEIAAKVLAPFLGAGLGQLQLERIIAASYRDFDSEALAPLKEIASDLWLLELFHGPTLAFKDYALQLVGRMFDEVLLKRGGRVTIVGATSGDTGSAAIEACRDRATADIFMLYPVGRISDVQRRQMTTVSAPNAHAVGIEGSFDDCQDLVKALFADASFRAAFNLSAVNSINWARIAAQTVYYFVAALALGAPDRKVSFSVPTGNFGNAYAAHVARIMGLPVSQIVIATNRNDILARFFNDGAMVRRAVMPTLSPSMDIQVASNFERLFFDLRQRGAREVNEAMIRFRTEGSLPSSASDFQEARKLFAAFACDDDSTVAEIANTWRHAGIMLDPHSAVGVAAARAKRNPAVPMIALGTAHPAKFPDAVESATGVRPALPPRLADLMERRERIVALPRDIKAVQDYVRAHARPQRGVAA
jgi:threonine synthase